MAKKAVDHLGNVYRTQADMCLAYYVSHSLYCKRRSRGYTVEEALLGYNKYTVVDPFGERHASVRAMCYFYNVPQHIYYKCLKEGISKDQILTDPKYKRRD